MNQLKTDTEIKDSLPKDFKNNWINFIYHLQDEICTALEQEDGKALFEEDKWERPGGGGGRTRVITNGNVFEKGGVNTSVVHGPVSDAMKQALKINGHQWFACGLSLVLHPNNPFVPTTHANWRYFELYDETGVIIDSWFGGGTDLTPYYLFDADATFFHTTLKNALLPFGNELYQQYKIQCDQYFANHHRADEMRGIGGTFYDHLRPATAGEQQYYFELQKATSASFLQAYLPIVQQRKTTSWEATHKYWQEIRRGRYVEFNLLHDRGTIFGLKTNGRTESILMSLPPTVRFDYDYKPLPGSEEDRLLQACLHPKDWAQ